MLQTPPDERIVQIQRVEHESRVHLDVETDDIPAEIARLERLGATVFGRFERRVVMQAPHGAALLRRAGSVSRISEELQPPGMMSILRSAPAVDGI